MTNNKNTPRVGLGVIIVNHEGKVLVGKRKNSHAPFYSIPGGHLDPGETFEKGAIREVKEETSLDIKNPKVIAVTNNLETYRNEGLHYISIALIAKEFSGVIKIMEPDKCEEWLWVDPSNLTTPHFEASRMAIDCYLEKVFYKIF
ncbi:NUDIX domain-containing protein [Patescibacteria group bacterium]|nr:NUDIX domain-containing protein [Patescibacteria group bacterium]MBU1890163.1 NUDIX domain-containing protein [Patescibacteria group bacterium]